MEVSGPLPPVKKTQWGESSMFLFSFSCFFRIVLTGKCFFEQALLFVKRMSKKVFCPSLHTARALISGLASSPVKPFNSSLSTFCSFSSTSTSLKVFLLDLTRNHEHYYFSLL